MPAPRAVMTGLELVVAVDLVCPGLLDVQHLAPHGENGLEAGIAPLDGATRGAVALNDVNFGQLGLFSLQSRSLSGIWPPASRAVLRRMDSRAFFGGLPARLAIMAFSRMAAHRRGSPPKLLQLLGDDVIHQRPDLTVAQLCLGLALNWASVSFTEMMQVRPSRQSSPETFSSSFRSFIFWP